MHMKSIRFNKDPDKKKTPLDFATSGIFVFSGVHVGIPSVHIFQLFDMNFVRFIVTYFFLFQCGKFSFHTIQVTHSGNRRS